MEQLELPCVGGGNANGSLEHSAPASGKAEQVLNMQPSDPTLQGLSRENGNLRTHASRCWQQEAIRNGLFPSQKKKLMNKLWYIDELENSTPTNRRKPSMHSHTDDPKVTMSCTIRQSPKAESTDSTCIRSLQRSGESRRDSEQI